MAIDKETLLKRRFGVEEVEIPGVGTVEVRPLSRAEALQLQDKGEMSVLEMERLLVSLAMVSPQLSEDEVGVWQENSPAGELQPIAEVITRISGMEQSSPKSGVS